MMRQVMIEYGQSILDIAIQEYGNASAAPTLVSDNQLSFDTLLTAGAYLNIRTEDVPGQDKQIREYFGKRGHKVVSGMPMNGEVIPQLPVFEYLQQEDEYYILLE